MDFSPNPDQATLLDAIEKIASRFQTLPIGFDGFCLQNDELDAALSEGQFFDIAIIPEFGAVAAAMAVERLARLPYATECALSMLVLPVLAEVSLAEKSAKKGAENRAEKRAEKLSRPLALIEHNRPGRFVAQARTVLLTDGDTFKLGQPHAGDACTVESLYAYPMATLPHSDSLTALPEPANSKIKSRLQLACAAELTGLMQAALDTTVEHVSVRKQFGRELGTFQAVRHRLAECAVLVGGVRQLMLKAADSDEPADAALAALHAQDSATRLTYDVHQLLGAMGMTLEMPLHLYTYRIKALLSELGGRSQQAGAAAQLCFREVNESVQQGG